MVPSQSYIDHLMTCLEGCRLTAYLDTSSQHVPTIGYGHTGGVQLGDRITQDEAQRLLTLDIQEHLRELRRRVPFFDGLPVPAQDALFDMAFNLGIGGLLEYPHMLAALKARDWDTAAAQCHRRGIGEARNQYTADLFLSCNSLDKASS